MRPVITVYDSPTSLKIMQPYGMNAERFARNIIVTTRLGVGFESLEFDVDADWLTCWKVANDWRRCHIELQVGGDVRFEGRITETVYQGGRTRIYASGWYAHLSDLGYTDNLGLFSNVNKPFTVKDVLSEACPIVAPMISTDLSNITSTGSNIGPLDLDNTYLSQVIETAVKAGDGSSPPNPLYFFVWQGRKMHIKARDTSDFQWRIPWEIANQHLALTWSLDGWGTAVRVRYSDIQNNFGANVKTAIDFDLEAQTGYRREMGIGAGVIGGIAAQSIADSVLQRIQAAITSGSIPVNGMIPDRNRALKPVGYVKAGDVIQVEAMPEGTAFDTDSPQRLVIARTTWKIADGGGQDMLTIEPERVVSTL